MDNWEPRYAVYDTNWVRIARSFDHLLGATADLQEISKYATIVNPRMALEEVIEDKRETFLDEFKSVNNSPIRKIMGLPTIEDHDERWRSIEGSLANEQSLSIALTLRT